MKVTDFTKGGIYCAMQKPFVFFHHRKVDTAHWITVLIVSIFFPLNALFAQAPALTGIEVSTLNYDEEQAPTIITGSITVSDADSPLLASATVQITGNYLGTEDLLQFANAFSITASYNATTGTLTLTGPASPADFTSALQTVTYQNSNNNNPSNLVRTISFGVNDGVFNSPIVTRGIQVNRINDAPIGQPDTFVMDEDTELDCGCLLTNDEDPDGDHLTALHGQPPAHGIVTDLGGFFIYTPDPDFYGTDTFTYYANDGTVNSNETVVHVTVRPVNDPPLAANDAIATNEDELIAIPLLANDTDVDDVLNASMIVLVSSPTHGVVAINTNTGAIEYIPNLDFTGNDSFTYQVKDASGALSNVATVNIIVNPVNDAPVANPDFANTSEEAAVAIDVLANDVDVDNTLDGTSLVLVTGPANGTLTKLGDLYNYTPNLDFTGTDSFSYYATDGLKNSNTTLVTITVSPVNDIPVVLNDAVSTDEDVAIGVPILSNDTDVDNVLDASMIVLASLPTQGTLSINTATNTVTYTPNLNFNGNDSFTYQVKDALGALSNVATVNITVVPVNDAPVANPDFANTQEETPILIPVLANDTDVDNTLDVGSLNEVSDPANGSLTIQSSGIILYTPRKDFTGTDSFTYSVKDQAGAISISATVTINVLPVNDPPVAVNDETSTNKNTPVNINILLNDYDIDGEVLPSSVVVTTSPIHGTVSVNLSSGVASFIPETGFTGNDSFTYTIQDADGLKSSAATVSITVIVPPNHAPHALDDAIVNSTLAPLTIDVLANDYDEDNSHDELSITFITNPSVGTVSIIDGKVVYQPGSLTSETVTFTYTIQDPSGLTAIGTVTIENQYPVLTVSEGFSPNNDNNNETWFMRGIENYPNNFVKVFDRWGFLVYQKQHYENTTAPWDGRGNTSQQSGKLLDQGTYYYILEPGGELKTMTGYVVIIR